jgi:hypothetical protein
MINIYLAEGGIITEYEIIEDMEDIIRENQLKLF